MLTPSDIVVLILLAGSGIFILIARRSSFANREDAPKAHDNESSPSAEQRETNGETNNHISHGQDKKKDTPCN